MRSYCLASLLVLATGTAAHADADMLGDALGKFPQIIVTNPEPVQAYFVNMQAIAQAGNDDEIARGRIDFGVIDALTPLMMGDVETWEENAGIGIDEIRYFAGIGQPPQTISIWGLADQEVAAGLVDGLAAKGFAPLNGSAVLGNGEPHRMDPSQRDVSNPWRGQLGQATFAAQLADAVVQSTAPEGVERFLADGENAAAHPVVATALAGVDAASESGVVVQAMLISPGFGLQGADIGSILMQGDLDMDAMRSQLEDQMAAAGEGIPPYFGGIIADIQIDRPALAMSVVYPDCDIATAASKLIEQRWMATMSDIAPGEPASEVVEGDDGLCSAVVLIASDSEDASSNPLSRAMFSAFIQRQFTVLQIGQ
ncbi:hypothetical protein [Pelagibacterium mangrovi]|uniref:hypothetical protein n=1 Tax=Pelagibacterium mangrovi TaxID=3119828 RepID=UPI002FC59B83